MHTCSFRAYLVHHPVSASPRRRGPVSPEGVPDPAEPVAQASQAPHDRVRRGPFRRTDQEVALVPRVVDAPLFDQLSQGLVHLFAQVLVRLLLLGHPVGARPVRLDGGAHGGDVRHLLSLL